MGLYVGKLRESLQTLVQGPLDYRLTSTMNTWKSSPSGIQQRDFDNAASLTIAALDAGTFQTSTSKPLLGSEDWGTLASACLAAIGRGFTRPLKEVSCKGYIEFWEGLDDNPQHKLDEGEEPEFHSLLQRLKATTQQLELHVNADEAEGMRKWATTARKEIEETARRASLAEVEFALHSWKTDQLSNRQKQLEDSLQKSILERNVKLFRDTAASFGLTLGDSATTLPSRPTPSAGGKRTVSGSAPQPAQPAESPLTPKIADPPVPRAIPLDIVTLTAAVQTAMQPFMARLAAIEQSTLVINRKTDKEPAPQPSNTRMINQPRAINQTRAFEQNREIEQTRVVEQTRPMIGQDAPKDAWVPVTNRRRRGKAGTNQANPILNQVNLTPGSYAAAVVATPTPNQTTTKGQQTKPAIPTALAFTEVTVIRSGGSFNLTNEHATRLRPPDAIVREVRANMARAVLDPLPVIAGRWSSGARSKGNFVFTFRGHINFAFIQTFEHFLTQPFPGGGQLCPNQGWTKLVAHGVPVLGNDDIVFGPEALLQEVQTMPGLQEAYFSDSPRWIKPVGQMKSCYSSLNFAFSDPDGSITNLLLKGKQALFGKQVQVERWAEKPPLIQCSRCHTLGHMASSKACRLPPDSVKCYICGKGHLADAHNRECTKAKQHKVAGECDCTPQCTSCNQLGHHARDSTCSARDGFRARKPRTRARATNVSSKPTEVPTEVPTQCLEPQAAPQLPTLEELPDEEMLDAMDDFVSNAVPRKFLSGPGLSSAEAFNKVATSAENKLEELGIPLPKEAGTRVEDLESQAKESERRIRIDGQLAPAECAEADNYDLAETLLTLAAGFFHPGMSDLKQRQLAAILSVYSPQWPNNNTPGAASTSSSNPLC